MLSRGADAGPRRREPPGGIASPAGASCPGTPGRLYRDHVRSDPPWLPKAAYHEAGHVVAAFELKRGVVRVAIAPEACGSFGCRRPCRMSPQGRRPAEKIERELIIAAAGCVAQSMFDASWEGERFTSSAFPDEAAAILAYAGRLLMAQKDAGVPDVFQMLGTWPPSPSAGSMTSAPSLMRSELPRPW